MEYRKIPKGNEQVSTIGIGGSHLHELDQRGMDELVGYALEQGVNLIDTAISYPEPLDMLGHALKSKRDKVHYQLHLGLTFPNGQYDRTRDIKAVRQGFESQLAKMQTDYADIGFIHYVDDDEDFDAVFQGGTFEYAQRLKEQGVIRHLGFASHDIDICNRFLDTGAFDICMFSINAAYDLDPVGNVPFEEIDMTGKDALTVSQKRAAFYRECEKRGVGIMVMKPYGGGTLLGDKTSPFGKAMSIPQCLQYTLDRPAVLSNLLGVRNKQDLEDAVKYYTASADERDYAFISDLQHKDMRGTCVYCNHCLPCPADIDIAAVHKYLDLILAGDDLAKEHYKALAHTAKDCIQCGACEGRCPFHVAVRDKMKLAVETIGL